MNHQLIHVYNYVIMTQIYLFNIWHQQVLEYFFFGGGGDTVEWVIVQAGRVICKVKRLSIFFQTEMCPNIQSCTWVASGGQAGIVRVHSVASQLLPTTAKDLKEALSSLKFNKKR